MCLLDRLPELLYTPLVCNFQPYLPVILYVINGTLHRFSNILNSAYFVICAICSLLKLLQGPTSDY